MGFCHQVRFFFINRRGAVEKAHKPRQILCSGLSGRSLKTDHWAAKQRYRYLTAEGDTDILSWPACTGPEIDQAGFGAYPYTEQLCQPLTRLDVEIQRSRDGLSNQLSDTGPYNTKLVTN